MKAAATRSFTIGVAAITVFIAGAAYFLYQIPKNQQAQGQWVTHTHEVINQLEILDGQVTKAVALHADYQQSHAASDLQAFADSQVDIIHTLAEIEYLTRDNQAQQVRIPPLRAEILQELAVLKQGMQPQLAVVHLAKPQAGMKEYTTIGDNIDVMRAEEDRLMQIRVKDWYAAMMRVQGYFLGGAGGLYLLLLLAFIQARRETRVRERMHALERETLTMNRSMAERMTQIVAIQQEIIASRMDLRKVMQLITEHTQRLTHADGAVIEMLEEGRMHYRATSGSMIPFLGFSLKAEGSLSGLCVKQGITLHCEDTEVDDRVDRQACREVGVRAIIVVPLVQEEQIIGVLKVASSKSHAFTVEDTGSLQVMAGVLSTALRDALTASALHDVNKLLSESNAELAQQNAKLASDRQALQLRADTDGMTGLKNHRYFQEELAQEFGRAKRYGNALTLIIFDVDHFKHYNDTFGHPAGDQVLATIGDILRENVRPSDCAARYGGEEFAVLLTQTSMAGAMITALRIRKAILEGPWEKLAITVSMGVTGLEFDADNPAALVEQADQALYHSKSTGRNRATSYEALKATKAA